MSIASVTLVDRGASISAAGQKTVNRIYQVETTDVQGDDELVVLSAAGLPKRYDIHPSDDNLWVSTLDAKPFEDRLHWRVTVNYEAKTYGAQGGNNTKPWDLPAQVSYFIDKEQTTVTKAYNYNNDVPWAPSLNVENSAADPFIDPLVKDKNRLGIRIVRNVEDQDFDPSIPFEYLDTLNQLALKVGGVSIGVREGRIKDMRLEPALTEDQDLYWVFTADIVLDQNQWIVKVFDQGFNEYLAGVKTAKTRCTVYDSTAGKEKPSPDPKALKSDGSAWEDGVDPVTDKHWCEFGIYPQQNWAGLNFPKDKDGVV